jgi:hypothetical protein
VDTLMNLELLFDAGKYPGQENQTLIDMAIKHVDNTFQYFVRPDGSSFHLGVCRVARHVAVVAVAAATAAAAGGMLVTILMGSLCAVQ